MTMLPVRQTRTCTHPPEFYQFARSRPSLISLQRPSPLTRQHRTFIRKPLIAGAQGGARRWNDILRSFSSTAGPAGQVSAEKMLGLAQRIYDTEDEIAQRLQDLDLAEKFPDLMYSEDLDLVPTIISFVGFPDDVNLADRAREIRQEFGDALPLDLTEQELMAYVRLYGEPVSPHETDFEEESVPEWSRQDGEGEYVKVDVPEPAALESEEAMIKRANEIAEMLGGEVVSGDDQSLSERTPEHPLVKSGKFMIGNSSTLTLPPDTMGDSISEILAPYANKHLKEGAHKIFGDRLGNSLRNPPKGTQQNPLPLSADQHFMSEMEGNLFMSILYPGMYATALSVLSEIRKRMGTKWVRDLINKEGGASFLDAGTGGAAALAWKDVLEAESSLMDDDEARSLPENNALGKLTVVTGSDALRHRASKVLHNTTFIPRLPDYIHVRNQPTLDDERDPPKRKQYDVIVGAYGLWPLREDYQRKEYVQNLWSLLNPNGGVLILIEKGVQRGFEAIAGARQMILDRMIASPGSTTYSIELGAGGAEAAAASGDGTITKEPGMIIAPCTNHTTCPMYPIPGKSVGRRDYCAFQQRYHRPAYMQTILEARAQNHEDVQFSFLAVQRGVDRRAPKSGGARQGPVATDLAFAGYESPTQQRENLGRASKRFKRPMPEPVSAPEPDHNNPSLSPADNSPFASPTTAFSLPRLILPPLKRHGHVTLDLCTPVGTIERWTVARSLSRAAYGAARKAAWGDLWALGAKSRASRSLRLGAPVEPTRREKAAAGEDDNNNKGKSAAAGSSAKAGRDDGGSASRRRELRQLQAELEEEGETEAARRLAANDVFIPGFQKTMGKFDPRVRVTKKMVIKERRKSARARRREEEERGSMD